MRSWVNEGGWASKEEGGWIRVNESPDGSEGGTEEEGRIERR